MSAWVLPQIAHLCTILSEPADCLRPDEAAFFPGAPIVFPLNRPAICLELKRTGPLNRMYRSAMLMKVAAIAQEKAEDGASVRGIVPPVAETHPFGMPLDAPEGEGLMLRRFDHAVLRMHDGPEPVPRAPDCASAPEPIVR